MNLKEIKKELKELQKFEKDLYKRMEPFFAELSEIVKRRKDLAETWVKKCKHKNIEEYCHYSSGGYDYSESSDYKRQCITCGLVESGKAMESKCTFQLPSGVAYVYENLGARPPSDKRFHGKEGNSLYFNPPQKAEILKYTTKL